MSKKKAQKTLKKKELEQNISPLLIINQDRLEPFIELFQFEPENITQRPLGMLFGFFKVNNTESESAYIVNFLTSVIKKEYYSNPKRSPENSFEAALHKANVALSEIAKQGNMQWLGQIEASLLVIENKTLHFTVSGSSRILLLRDESLVEASEGLSSDEAQDNPLKTFTDVSSGKLLPGDKIIAASQELFELFHTNEVEQKALAFDQGDFQQFIHTALVNEFDLACSFIVDITEKEIIQSVPKPIKKMPKEAEKKLANVFSQTAFTEKTPETSHVESKEIPEKTIEELEYAEKDYTDEKTGHIYIQQKSYPSSPDETSPFNQRFLLFKEHFMNHWDVFVAKFHKEKKLAQKKVSRQISNISHETFNTIKESVQQKAPEQATHEVEIEKEIIIKEEQGLQQKVPQRTTQPQKVVQKQRVAQPQKVAQPQIEKDPMPEVQEKPLTSQQEPAEQLHYRPSKKPSATLRKTARTILFTLQRSTRSSLVQVQRLAKNIHARLKDAKQPSQKHTDIPVHKKEGRGISFKQLLPNFHKMRTIIANMDYSQRVILIVIILAIIFTPLIVRKFQDRPTEEVEENINSIENIVIDPNDQNTPQPQEDPSALKQFPEDAITLLHTLDKTPQNIFTGKDGSVLAIDEAGITIVNNDSIERQELPAEYGLILQSTYMDSLNLIFLATTSLELISFAPTSETFEKNSIELPDTTNFTHILAMQSYSTYLYLLDENESTIYRFARTTGGFFERKQWLKEEVSTETITDLAIDGNAYIASKSNLKSYFRGKRSEEFSLRDLDDDWKHSLITTHEAMQNIYSLDAEKGNLVILDKEGSIQDQITSKKLKNAVDMSVSFDEEKLHILLKTGELYEYNLINI